MSERTNLKTCLAMVVFLLAIGPAFAAGSTIYVDASATGSNDGSSWANAYNYLQDALAVAGDGNEIWVAEGTYKPDANTADPNGSGDRTATFQLINGVGIYGGFAGWETSLDERDWQTNETILSGDLNGDDVPAAEVNMGENSYHVVTGSGTNATAILDGFTIIAGNANSGIPYDAGGGMINKNNSSPTVSNCNFIRNNYGGMYNYNNSNPTVTNCTSCGTGVGYAYGMVNVSSSPMMTGCTFYNNHCGMSNNDSNPTLTNCTFIDNGGYGGMGNYNNSNPTLTNCTFSGNWAGSGGGMSNSRSHPTLTNCIFSGNGAGSIGGGGMYNYWDSSATLTNCTFSGNSAGQGGGMCNCDNSSATLTNCILWGNTASEEGPQIALDPLLGRQSTVSISYCDLQGGQAAVYDPCGGLVWGAGNIDADPMFVDANGPDDTVGTEDDNLRLWPGSPCIDAGDNAAVPSGVTMDLDGHPRFLDDLCTTNTGNGTPPIVDMGAYEFAYIYFGDFDGDCDLDVDFADFAILALAWLTAEGQPGYNPACDISLPADKYIDWRDLDILTDNWLAGL